MSGGFASKRNMANGRIGLGTAIPVSKVRKEPMMKLTFKQRIRRWLMNDEDEMVPILEKDSVPDIEDHNTLRFSVTDVIGGKIVQVKVYDQRHDNYTTKTHIVTPEENLVEALAHIFTIEKIGR